MDRLDRFRVFVQVAELGSFIRAANLLGLPRTTVSAAVQQLESDIGARLFHRTTRTVRLSADGAQLLEHARALLAQAEDIDRLFGERRQRAAGRLRVDAPSRIAHRLILPALPKLLERHPELHIELGSRDRLIDLVQEGVDCAIRFGALNDSSLIAHALGEVAQVTCASPAYLRETGTPRHPDDLQSHHRVIGYATASGEADASWEARFDGRELHIPMPSRVSVDDVESYLAACRAGLGIIQVPRFDVAGLLARGELVEVLPQARATPLPVAVLYPHRRQRSRRLSVFIDWFSELMRPHLLPR